MQESTKRIAKLEERVRELESFLKYEQVRRRQDARLRDREVRHLSAALFKKNVELRETRAQVMAAWKECRERMTAAGLDVRGQPLKKEKENEKKNGMDLHEAIGNWLKAHTPLPGSIDG